MKNEPQIRFDPVTKENWEEALKLKVKPEQQDFVPSPAVSLATAYVVPWDEAFDPYLIYADDKPVGMYYLSYTPDSTDNYWFGGFFIDESYQGQGLGNTSFMEAMKHIQSLHPKCKLISLTVEKTNWIAAKLYEKHGFVTDNKLNRDGEVIYRLKL